MDMSKERDEETRLAEETTRIEDMIDEASEESFPASDPPSFTPTTTPNSPGKTDSASNG